MFVFSTFFIFGKYGLPTGIAQFVEALFQFMPNGHSRIKYKAIAYPFTLFLRDFF
jgi:hypothetical protein